MANTVESSYSQLGEVGLLQTVTLPQVDTLANLLPTSIRRDLDKHFHILTHGKRIKPFPHLMRFLEQERQIALRRIETVNSEFSSMHKQKVKVFHTESSGAKSSSNRFIKITKSLIVKITVLFIAVNVIVLLSAEISWRCL